MPGRGFGVHRARSVANDDASVAYDGTAYFPSAPDLLTRHAEFLGCDTSVSVIGPEIDIERNLPGLDTTVQSHEVDCAPGTSVELWTIEGGSHIPFFEPTFAPMLLDWLFAKTG